MNALVHMIDHAVIDAIDADLRAARGQRAARITELARYYYRVHLYYDHNGALLDEPLRRLRREHEVKHAACDCSPAVGE